MVKPLILVTMGTNDYPFNRLYEYIKNDPLYNDSSVEWFIQTGTCQVAEQPLSGTVQTLVTRAEMEELVQRSSLVISHCGIGSLNLMLQYQKRVIFVPRVAKHNEFSDDHQLQIAREIRNKKMTIVYPDDEFPLLDISRLEGSSVGELPVDITNYELARVIEFKLTG